MGSLWLVAALALGAVPDAKPDEEGAADRAAASSSASSSADASSRDESSKDGSSKGADDSVVGKPVDGKPVDGESVDEEPVDEGLVADGPNAELRREPWFGFGRDVLVVKDKTTGEEIGWEEFYTGAGRKDLAESYNVRFWTRTVCWVALVATFPVILPVGAITAMSLATFVVPSLANFRSGVQDALAVASIGLFLVVVPIILGVTGALVFVDDQPVEEDEMIDLVQAFPVPESE